jgi:AcrR family transcriptional regulator
MPVQQARARSRQQKILNAAASVFAKRGYQDVGMDEIARASGTSKGGVYFHFPGKDAVLLALLDQTSTLLRRKVEKAIAAADDPVARAEAALHVLLQTLSKHRSLARIFAIEALGAGGRLNQRVMQIQDEFAVLIQAQLDEAIVAGAIPPIDTRVAAQAWIGIFHSVIMRWLTAKERGESSPDLDETYETIRIMLFRSVGADPGHLPGAVQDDRDGQAR